MQPLAVNWLFTAFDSGMAPGIFGTEYELLLCGVGVDTNKGSEVGASHEKPSSESGGGQFVSDSFIYIAREVVVLRKIASKRCVHKKWS